MGFFFRGEGSQDPPRSLVRGWPGLREPRSRSPPLRPSCPLSFPPLAPLTPISSTSPLHLSLPLSPTPSLSFPNLPAQALKSTWGPTWREAGGSLGSPDPPPTPTAHLPCSAAAGSLPRPPARTPRRGCPDGSRVAAAPAVRGRWGAWRCPPAGTPPPGERCPAAAAPLVRFCSGGVSLRLA